MHIETTVSVGIVYEHVYSFMLRVIQLRPINGVESFSMLQLSCRVLQCPVVISPTPPNHTTRALKCIAFV